MMMVPRCLIDEILSRLEKIEAQNRVIQQQIADDQVARMSTEYLDLEQAAKVLHCKAKTLERLRMKGELAYSQYGKKIVIKRSDIDDFLDAYKKNRLFLEAIANRCATEPQLPLEGDEPEASEEGGTPDDEC